MKNVSLVITDLDDTIWDWLEMWYNSFNPYLIRISNETGISYDELLIYFKNLHTKYGTTEISYAYKEILQIDPKHYSNFDNILDEYFSNKRKFLYLYEGVEETLKYIKFCGAKIASFTESYLTFSIDRIYHLGLDSLIDAIYAPEDSSLQLIHPMHLKFSSKSDNILIKPLPIKIRKPDPELLRQIVKDFGVDKQNVIYIGDKLERDVSMANNAGVISVHAKYGFRFESAKYQLVRSVSHWRTEDLLRESNPDNLIVPKYTISKYSDLCKLFKFCP